MNSFAVGSRRHINLPGIHYQLPALTEDDKESLLFAIKEGFDYIALSFTRTADDVQKTREFLEANGGAKMKIIAKIENQEGVDNIDVIIDASDMIMVAR